MLRWDPWRQVDPGRARWGRGIIFLRAWFGWDAAPQKGAVEPDIVGLLGSDEASFLMYQAYIFTLIDQVAEIRVGGTR